MENNKYLRENGGDYYALPARLALLASIIEIMPMVHCKSGKDRTARLIEESKFLALSIKFPKSSESPEPSRIFPEPGALTES